METQKQMMTPVAGMDAIDIMVRDMLAEKLGIDTDKIMSDASFKYDLGVDSLDFMEILTDFEKIFRIKFEDEDVEGFTTVQSLINYVKKNIR